MMNPTTQIEVKNILRESVIIQKTLWNRGFPYPLKPANPSSLKASYNRSVQHINQINNSISPFNSLEVWLPSGPNIKPQYADIYDLGVIKAWNKADMDISADVYYKSVYDQLDYARHAELFLNPYLEGEIRQGSGYAYGFEIMLKKTAGKLTGQVSYAHTRSYIRIAGPEQCPVVPVSS